MKTAVITFPGSNCDRDMFTAIRQILGADEENKVIQVWHQDSELPDVDLVALPGGFSYGDYLRSGAISARSPIMQQVVAHAKAGGYVLGVCNGFQVLTESGLLPGTLLRNRDLRFLCKTVTLQVGQVESAFTSRYETGQMIQVPIAHHDGNYYADSATLDALEAENRIAFRYAGENPNGSARNIAGILSENHRVLGMMPHPERAVEVATGGDDGRGVFEGVLAA